MAAGKRDAGFVAGKTGTVEDELGGFDGDGVDGPAQDGNGHQGRATHCIDVADGVDAGDTAEVDRVVDDGHEEVGGADDARAVAEIIDGGVIARVVANKEMFAGDRRDSAVEDLVKDFRRDLAPTSGTVRVLRQTIVHGTKITR